MRGNSDLKPLTNFLLRNLTPNWGGGNWGGWGKLAKRGKNVELVRKNFGGFIRFHFGRKLGLFFG